MKTNEDSSKRFSIALGGMITVLLTVDLFVGPVFNIGDGVLSAVAIGLVTGVFAGQLNLISVWAAISRGPVIVRLPWAYLLLFLVWAAIVVGSQVFDERFSRTGILDLGIVLLACCTVAQIPLWIASRVMGWELCRRLEQDQPASFNLSHMFTGTLILAVMLVIARTLLLGTNEQLDSSLDDENKVVLCVLTVANLAVVVPFVWIGFMLPLNVVTVLVSVFVAALTAIVEFFVLGLLVGSGGPDFEVIVALTSFNFGQILVVIVVMRLLKRHGFGLIRTHVRQVINSG